MNKTIEQFARISIINGLKQLPETQQIIFRLMYGRDNGNRSVEDAKKIGIAALVEEIPADKLDWALTQIENSIKKLSVKANG